MKPRILKYEGYWICYSLQTMTRNTGISLYEDPCKTYEHRYMIIGTGNTMESAYYKHQEKVLTWIRGDWFD